MMKIINFEKKKIIPLTSKEYESYLYQKDCHIFKNSLMIKIIVKLKTIAILQVNTKVLHKTYVI